MLSYDSVRSRSRRVVLHPGELRVDHQSAPTTMGCESNDLFETLVKRQFQSWCVAIVLLLR
jgi:hypothetical protein